MLSKLFEWSKTSTDDYFSHYEIQKNDGSWEEIGNNMNYRWNDILEENTYTFRVRAVSLSGQYSNILEWAFESLQPINLNKVTEDMTTRYGQLVINKVSPDEFNITYQKDYIFEWEHIFGTSLSHYEIKIDENDWITNNLNTTYTWNNITDGLHTFKVRAVSYTNDYSEELIWKSITYDTPITIEKVTTDIQKQYQTITIEKVNDITEVITPIFIFEWNKISGMLDHYEISKDGGTTWESVLTDSFYEWIGITSGTYTLDVKAIDVNSNESEIITWNFTATDNISIEKGTISNYNSLDYSKEFTWTLNYGTLDHYEISKDNGGTWESIGTVTTYAWENITEKENIIFKVKAITTNSNESNIIEWVFDLENMVDIVIEKKNDFILI